jgi:hypothetical protein
MTEIDDGRFPFGGKLGGDFDDDFGGNELRSRADFQRALLSLCEPFAAADGLARQLAASAQPGAHYTPRVARLELVSRLLWGLAPFAAGGGTYRGWQPIRDAITSGTDPRHPDYWGPASDYDQRIVEAAALGFGLAICPGELWEPLTSEQRNHFTAWLRQAAHCRAHDNNWLLFATMVGLGLDSVGEPLEPEVTEAAFERVEAFYRGDGWYSDGGPGRAFDHYGPWALHFYGLINARLGTPTSTRAKTFVDRAREFAPHYLSWFAADGAGLAFGRSMTYRFAQAAFFGALAFADEPGPGWGVLRGAWARHLRWWARRPILNGDGTLPIGYAYPNLQMSETYNSPASPYWAFKAFLPLALPADHPFWTHPEEPAPRAAAAQAYPKAGMIIRHDRAGHATALAAAPGAPWSNQRHAGAKYAKFAYSTAFGFAVPTAPVSLGSAAIDSMLAFSEEGRYWRTRFDNTRWSVDEEQPDEAGPAITAVWSPWPDVEVETRLRFAGDWHIREHRITTARPLHTAEGAFCVPLAEDTSIHETETSALAGTKDRASGIRDLTGGRHPAILRPDPNSSLLWPRTLLPALRAELAPGEHHLITAVYADSTGDVAGFEDRPRLA